MPVNSKTIRGIFPACCCASTIGTVVKRIVASSQTDIFLFIAVVPIFLLTPDASRLTFHLITFSARIITTGGIVRPSALAVFRLITSSNLVGCSTGRSAGLAPFRILSTINGGAPVGFDPVGSVGHQATAVDKISPRVYRRQPIFDRKVGDLFSIKH